MEGQLFYKQVQAHAAIEWLGAREGRSSSEDEVLIHHTESGTIWAVAITSVLKHSWRTLEAVLTGKESPSVMIHISRIVGYYSRIQNWNRSKKQELIDRQAGMYALPGGDKDGPSST